MELDSNKQSKNNCSIFNNITFSEANNFTIRIQQFDTFRSISDSLFRLIFGHDISGESDMYKIEIDMTGPIIGAYICLMALIFLNVFVAVINYSLQTVYDKAEAYMKLQRAYEILKIEVYMNTKPKSLMLLSSIAEKLTGKSLEERYSIFRKSKEYNPYKDEKRHNKRDTKDEEMNDIKNEIFEIKNKMSNEFVNIIFKFIIY